MMVLDNEEQRQLLLQLITTTPIQGNFMQAKEAVLMLDGLMEDVNNAEIKLG